MKNKYQKLSLFSLALTLICLLSVSINVFAVEKTNQHPSKVINEITIEDIEKEKVIKTENFTLNGIEYVRHYTKEADYYVTCNENGKTQYYVNLLNIYPMVKHSETVNSAKSYGKYKNKKFVKMYYDRYEHFVLTFDLLDTQESTFIAEGKEHTGVKYNHFVKIKK